MRRRAVDWLRSRARRAALASGCAGALLCVWFTPAAAAAGESDVWALVRQADGDVEVMHGADALDAAADDAAGRTQAEVLSLETDVPVHALGTNDPLRPQQWPLDHTSFEGTW